jgi:hypothetical protein
MDLFFCAVRTRDWSFDEAPLTLAQLRGYEVIVANARHVRLIGERRKKDDRLDAQILARLARIDAELDGWPGL